MMRLLVAAFPHHPATEHRICDAASLAKLLMAGYAADSPFRYVQAEVNGQHVSVVLLTGTSYADDRPTWLRDDILAAVGGVTRYEQLVDDRLVSAAPSRPVYLVGHSLGGMIAELIASRPPHGVRIAGVQTYGAPKVARHRVPAARYAIPLDPAVRSAMLWQPWESSDPQYTYVDAGVLTGRVPGAVTGPLYFLTGITSTAFLPLDAPLGAFLHVDYDGAVGLERYPALPGLARHACIDLQVVPDQPGGQAMARPART
jgi:pimeloyl-ACP methyl ester carboxylesterase